MTTLALLMMAALLPQGQAPPALSAPPETSPSAVPVSIERIERALASQPALKPDTVRPVFRVEVFGRKPTIIDFIGSHVLEGPVPVGSRAHQEFLDMVTPDDVRGYAAFSNKEGAVVAATSLVNAALLNAAVRGIRGIRTLARRHAEAAASREVAAALAELERARVLAGLPAR